MVCRNNLANSNGPVTVFKAYIESFLGLVGVVLKSDGGLGDPLEDGGSLCEQLDRLLVICRFQYAVVAQLILTKFDALMGQYRTVLDENDFGIEEEDA